MCYYSSFFNSHRNKTSCVVSKLFQFFFLRFSVFQFHLTDVSAYFVYSFSFSDQIPWFWNTSTYLLALLRRGSRSRPWNRSALRVPAPRPSKTPPLAEATPIAPLWALCHCRPRRPGRLRGPPRSAAACPCDPATTAAAARNYSRRETVAWPRQKRATQNDVDERRERGRNASVLRFGDLLTPCGRRRLPENRECASARCALPADAPPDTSVAEAFIVDANYWHCCELC